jgi:hypothetical protein
LGDNYSIRRDFNRAEAVSEAMLRSIDVFDRFWSKPALSAMADPTD